MTPIAVRRPNFQWPSEPPVLPIPNDVSKSCELVALSFTLPYLEPYLIRTMRVAAKQVQDPDLRVEMKAFSSQEAQHFQNHARINELVRNQLSPTAATAMRLLEDELEDDYRRYSATKSLAFNLAYAEGFEAMTFAFARSVLNPEELNNDVASEWANLLGWHLAEEVEHRTVTFDAYQAIVGRYPYRLAVGSWAQAHYLKMLIRMAAALQRNTSDVTISTLTVAGQTIRRNWENGMLAGTLRAMLPSYNPRNVTISDDVRRIAASQGVDLDRVSV